MDNSKHYKHKRFGNTLLVEGLALSNKVHDFVINASKISKSAGEVDMMMLEYNWTDMLKQLMDFGNKFLLDNFNLCLTLED